jgi:flavin reductase (DIM6/NTAB) family NADH-FMN oxidoreductase RutF
MTISADLFREVFRRWPSGVAVVTSCEQNRPHGMVISSFASLSNDPPTVMFSASSSTRMHAIVPQQGAFAISILGGEQGALFERFAGFDRTFDSNRFIGLDYATARTGMPVFPDGIAWIDCKLVASHPGNGYTIFVGEIVAASLGEACEGEPMVYYRRRHSALPYESTGETDLSAIHAHNSAIVRVPGSTAKEIEDIDLLSGG